MCYEQKNEVYLPMNGVNNDWLPVEAEAHQKKNKMLGYGRETALQGALVLANSGRLELGDNILRTL